MMSFGTRLIKVIVTQCIAKCRNQKTEKKNPVLGFEIDGYKETNTVNYLSESRRQKRGEKGLRWTAEGFPPSPSAAMSLREAEAPELVRFSIFLLFFYFPVQCAELVRFFNKVLFCPCVLCSCNEKIAPELN